MKSTENMKLVMVKFYQGVKIGADTESSIEHGRPVRDQKSDDQGKIKCSLEEVEHGVLIHFNNRAVLATWNNVQYAEYIQVETDAETKSLDPQPTPTGKTKDKTLAAALERQKA